MSISSAQSIRNLPNQDSPLSQRKFSVGIYSLCLSCFLYFRRERSSKFLNCSSRVFFAAVAREKDRVLDKVLDSYPAWILWLVEGRPLPLPLPPPPLDETRRLEARLSLGPPTELGRELEAATAFLEEEDGLYLEELFGLSESPCCHYNNIQLSLSCV